MIFGFPHPNKCLANDTNQSKTLCSKENGMVYLGQNFYLQPLELLTSLGQINSAFGLSSLLIYSDIANY